MDVSVHIYRSGKWHKATVIARPHTAAALGEHVLLEAHRLIGVPENATALQALRAAYLAIAEEVARRLEGG